MGINAQFFTITAISLHMTNPISLIRVLIDLMRINKSYMAFWQEYCEMSANDNLLIEYAQEFDKNNTIINTICGLILF